MFRIAAVSALAALALLAAQAPASAAALDSPQAATKPIIGIQLAQAAPSAERIRPTGTLPRQSTPNSGPASKQNKERIDKWTVTSEANCRTSQKKGQGCTTRAR